MTLTIELTPEEEARLQEGARRAGVAPGAYVHQLIQAPPSEAAPLPRPTSPQQTMTQAEWLQRFNNWVESPKPSAVEIPAEMLRREHLYDDLDRDEP